MTLPDVTTSTDELLYVVHNGIGHATLNRPAQRNALTFAMYARLAEICRSMPTDGSVKALIVRGAGEKAFGAGTDISQFRDFKGAEDGLAYEARMAVILGAIEACPVPTIAAIAGACTGGGAAIAACCDIRIATRDMRFGFPIARTLGNCLSSASLAKLASLIGPGRVAEMLISARLVDGDEALRIGLVTELHETADAVFARAAALAQTIAGHAPITMRVTKEMLRRLRTGEAESDKDLVAMAYGSADFREGLEAFLAKRPPQWTGR